MKIKELFQELGGYDLESEILVLYTGMETIINEHKTECHLFDEHRKLITIECGNYSSGLNEYYSQFTMSHFYQKNLPLPSDIVPALLLANQEPPKKI